jgi:predicted kinase
MDLVLCVGVPASGKSTFCRERFAASHAQVSLDLLRGSAHPRRRQEQLIAEALAAGRSVVVDNTNPTVADRAPLIALGRVFGATVIAYCFETPVADAVRRNRQREGRARVPDVAIYATAKKLVGPSYVEGFDAVYRVRVSEDGGFAVAALDATE